MLGKLHSVATGDNKGGLSRASHKKYGGVLLVCARSLSTKSPR